MCIFDGEEEPTQPRGPYPLTNLFPAATIFNPEKNAENNIADAN